MERVIKVVQLLALVSYLVFFIASEMNVIDTDISKVAEKVLLLVVTFCIGYTWGYERGHKKQLPSKIRKGKDEE